MMYKAKVTVWSDTWKKHSTQSERNVEFFNVNLLKTTRNLLYVRNQSVPRSKHFPPQL